MCCFSAVAAPERFWNRWLGTKHPPLVSATRILARMVDDATQVLVYSMKLSVAGEVAMILPLPVAQPRDEGALSFLSLDGHAGFFDELAALFVVPEPAAARGGFGFAPAPQARPRLVVHDVGSFEASFVPTPSDFDRLDPRFVLPSVLLDTMPAYAAYGFAVFRLKPGRTVVHPMAFRFRTAQPAKLFFPTVHVHDGQMHAHADFDHQLYYQHPAIGPLPFGSEWPTLPGSDQGSFMLPRQAVEGTLDTSRPVLRRELVGSLPNQDTWVSLV